MRATPEMRDFVRRVIAFETRDNRSATTKIPVVFAVCEKLQPQWVNLMGDVGFRTLLSRALTMAHQRVAWLRAVHVKVDGTMAWAGDLETKVDAEEMAEGSAVLIAELLGLLEGFIGETLALRLMQDVWPKLPPP